MPLMRRTLLQTAAAGLAAVLLPLRHNGARRRADGQGVIAMRHLTRLLLLALLVVLACAVEPTTLTFQRATVAKAAYDAEAVLAADPLGNTDRVLRTLLDRKACTVETLGTATLVDGAFALDTTSAVHFFAPTADGRYTLETAERKVGFRCSGTLSTGQPPYTLSYELYVSHLKGRLPVGFAKDLAPDLDAGLPEMDSMDMRSARHLVPDVPSPLGGGTTGQDLPMVTIVFVVLH